MRRTDLTSTLKELEAKPGFIINCVNVLWLKIFIYYKLSTASLQTGRAFKTRKKEHERNVKKCKSGSNIANHAWANDHRIDFKNGKVIDHLRNRLNFDLNKSRQKFHHSLKEHHKISNIPKFRCKML